MKSLKKMSSGNYFLLFKKNGFSLMGIVISIAVSSILILALMAFSFSVSEFFVKTDRYSRLNQSVEEIRNLLSKQGQCTKNFSGLSFQSSSTVPTAFSEISFFKDLNSTAPGEKIYETNRTNLGITIQDMKIVPGNNILDNSVNAATLNITFKNETSDELLIRTLPIYIEAKSNIITNCWSKKSEGDMIGDQVCTLISGDVYNPITKTCEPAKTIPSTLHSGTPHQASCPTGKRLVPGASACAFSTFSGWVDPQPIKSFRLTNGQILSKIRQAARFNVDTSTNTCFCYWSTNISSSDVSHMTCKARCTQ